MNERARRLFPKPLSVVGMVHLEPLPGAPRFGGSLESVIARALADVRALARGGVDGVMVENFGDAPFYPGSVPSITIAAMSVAVQRIRDALPARLPLGVNVLRNDVESALSIATATGAAFVRVNVLTGATVTDQGLIQGRAHEVLRHRRALAADVAIFADARVKHGRPLAPMGLSEEIADLVERGGADVVLLTGARTGEPPAEDELREAQLAAGGTPIWAASGIRAALLPRLGSHLDGMIVGTSIKRGGRTLGPVDVSRVQSLMRAVGAARRARPRTRRAR